MSLTRRAAESGTATEATPGGCNTTGSTLGPVRQGTTGGGTATGTPSSSAGDPMGAGTPTSGDVEGPTGEPPVPPDLPGTGEGGAAIADNDSFEGSTGGLAEVNAMPESSPKAIAAPYDGAPASGSGSYQSLGFLDVPSQCDMRPEHPRV